MLTLERAKELNATMVTENSLVLHAKNVCYAMGAMAEYFGEDVEHWQAIGMLHDYDYEKFPEEHLQHTKEPLLEAGVPEDIIHSVVSHGYGLTVELKPEHHMEKVLYACDELTGLIWAAALMRPSKSTKDMNLKSLKKKYKTKKFAAGCSRDVIEKGAEMLGWELDELLEKTLQAMQACEDEIGSSGL